MKQTQIQTKQKIDSTNRKTKPKYRQFMLKNNQSDLEATMICLLSHFASIEFTKPQKEVKVTKEFLKIKNIKFSKEKLKVNEWRKERFFELKENMKKEEKVNDRLITHRMEQINRSEMMHLIEDILFLFGVFVFIEQEETNGISGDCVIWFRGMIIYQNEFGEIAENVRMYIKKKMGEKKKIKIEQGELVKLLSVEKQILLNSL